MTDTPRIYEIGDILSATPEDQQTMRVDEGADARLEAEELRAVLRDRTDLTDPATRKLMRRAEKAFARQAAAEKSHRAWLWSKGIGR